MRTSAQHAVIASRFAVNHSWVAGSTYPRTVVGHPAPPLSWVGSHEAVLASCVVPRCACDGKCKQSQCQPAAQLAASTAQICHEQHPADPESVITHRT